VSDDKDAVIRDLCERLKSARHYICEWRAYAPIEQLYEEALAAQVAEINAALASAEKVMNP